MRWREHGQPVGGGPMLDYAPFDSIYGVQGPGPELRLAGSCMRIARCALRSICHALTARGSVANGFE